MLPDSLLPTMTGEHVLAFVEHLLSMSSNDSHPILDHLTCPDIPSFSAVVRAQQPGSCPVRSADTLLAAGPPAAAAPMGRCQARNRCDRRDDAARRCGTARSCFCSPRPDCATRSSDHSSFRISTGAPPKCLCGEPRRSATESCRSCRKRARRLPTMSCMPGRRVDSPRVFLSYAPPVAPVQGPAPPFRGSCDRDWSEAGLSFPASRAPICCAIAWRHSSSGNVARSTRSRISWAIGASIPPPYT